MCQLFALPEVPFLFSQFFAGNIWAVTLVTGNPTNVLLAEDLGDTFVSFAARMGVPGVAAGLVSFALMYITNRTKVDVRADPTGREAGLELAALDAGDGPGEAAPSHSALGRFESVAAASAPSSLAGQDSEGDGDGERSSLGSRHHSPEGERGSARDGTFTRTGVFCLVRVLTATLICALESVHGLPVYLVVLIMGACSIVVDGLIDAAFVADTLRHMPWELFSFVTGFLVLAEAMSVTGISLALASVFLPLAHTKSVAYVSGFATVLVCNLNESLIDYS